MDSDETTNAEMQAVAIRSYLRVVRFLRDVPNSVQLEGIGRFRRR